MGSRTKEEGVVWEEQIFIVSSQVFKREKGTSRPDGKEAVRRWEDCAAI